mmetsp:Transcript_36184/g.104136  ORF Transcript_36184/g.104136 Transcript_36184/m.104136 type:complete len:256 (-) Transcript_36184:127-894(-)
MQTLGLAGNPPIRSSKGFIHPSSRSTDGGQTHCWSSSEELNSSSASHGVGKSKAVSSDIKSSSLSEQMAAMGAQGVVLPGSASCCSPASSADASENVLAHSVSSMGSESASPAAAWRSGSESEELAAATALGVVQSVSICGPVSSLQTQAPTFWSRLSNALRAFRSAFLASNFATRSLTSGGESSATSTGCASTAGPPAAAARRARRRACFCLPGAAVQSTVAQLAPSGSSRLSAQGELHLAAGTESLPSHLVTK